MDDREQFQKELITDDEEELGYKLGAIIGILYLRLKAHGVVAPEEVVKIMVLDIIQNFTKRSPS